MRCPVCREAVDAKRLVCASGHQFGVEDGVFRLIDPDLAAEIASLSVALSDFRDDRSTQDIPPEAYDRLPDGRQGLEWRLRRYDLRLIEHFLSGLGNLSILDVGAWNGWLSNRLAGLGHQVTAVDYFADLENGLGARRHFSGKWQAYQLDLMDLSALEERYDLVILNRCLPFFPRPVETYRRAMKMVAPAGRLIATGLQLFADPKLHYRRLERERRTFKERYGRDLFLRPAKGYLNMDDGRGLAAAGLKLKGYRPLWLANLKSRFWQTAPRHVYGISQQTTDGQP